MDTRIVTKNYRLNQWAGIISDCSQSGLKVDDYCEAHGITHHQYYYWLKKVRTAALASDQGGAFVDITDFAYPQSSSQGTAALLTVNGHELKIMDGASQAFIRNLLGALGNA